VVKPIILWKNVFIGKHSVMDARSWATSKPSDRRSVHREPREEKVRKVGRRGKGNLVESIALNKR